ncbi:hypothetical protein AB0D74_43070 [Streptomyces sp. NPDC048278]|uniref:hypothetical protein n=1 Tax=Streptomyces sp. NPDC048278 TaxID=3155809 RepID=UPI00341AB1B3
MRLGGAAVRRIWTVELHPRAGVPSLVCTQCTARTPACGGVSARSAALAHLACHAQADALPGHLRTCQCQAQGCRWHPRHRGCAGPVRLALTQGRGGRAWRLADTCTACAAATSHTAVVPDTQLGSPRSPAPSAARGPRRPGAEERLRVGEMLTYLAAALPQFTSAAARLLAVQCALRTDACGRARLPAGLLRSMRLSGRREIWEELAHGAWLQYPDLRSTPVEVRLLDATALDQAPGRPARCRAADWALRPVPLFLPATSPPALRLIALVLAAYYTSDRVARRLDMEVLTRLSGHSRQQTAELLDRLVAVRALAAWRQDRDTDEVLWELLAPQHMDET